MRVFSATFAAALRREPSLSPWRLAHWSQRARRWYQDGVSWLVLSLSYRLNCRQHLLLRESISPLHDYASGNLRHSVWLVRLCRDELRGPAAIGDSLQNFSMVISMAAARRWIADSHVRHWLTHRSGYPQILKIEIEHANERSHFGNGTVAAALVS